MSYLEVEGLSISFGGLLAPDWKPIVWSEAERKKGQAWGLPTILSFYTHGTPHVE